MTPLLFLIISGIVESGRAFLAYIQLANAAREGARVGSFTPKATTDIDSRTRRELPAWISTNVVNVTVTCAPAASETFSNCVSSYSPASGDKIKVEVAYAYSPIMPVVNYITTLMTMSMTTAAVMRVQ